MKQANEKKLFLIFTGGEDSWDTYEKTKQLMESEIEKMKGCENARFYTVLSELLNSINNAGCENRRAQQIELIRSEQRVICDNYEQYLP